MGGVFIIRAWEFDLISIFKSGNLFFILASISWVCVTITTSLSKNRTSYMTYSFWSFTIAFLICLPIAYSENLFSVFEFDHIFWINLIISSFIAMSFGTSIYFLASIELGPKQASAYIFLVPITAIGFAILFLSEKLQLSTLIGGILGISAVSIINNAERVLKLKLCFKLF